MYKRVPCRYFEPSTGKPLGSGCPQAESCRFIHPDDSNWRNARKEPYTPKTPLPSQPFAFRRHQRDLSDSPRRYRDNRPYTQPGRDNDIRRPSSDDRDLQRNFHRRDLSRSEHRTDVGRPIVQQNDAAQRIIKTEEMQVDRNETLRMPKENVVADNPKQDKHTKRMDLGQENPGQVWNAFMQMARLTRESDLLAEQQRKEESKLATYAAVEKTLNEISTQMGLAVIPQIDQSTLIQDDCKKTIADNNETVNRLCKEVVQHFVSNVTNAVDKHLQTALQHIRAEADNLGKEIQKRDPQSAGRWEGQASAMRSSRSLQDLDKGVCRTKRRRIRSPSPYSPRRSASKEGYLASSELMKELEAKIERQAQALINLSNENEKLRAQNVQLRTPLPAAP